MDEAHIPEKYINKSFNKLFMVVELFLKTGWLRRRISYSLLLGVIFTFISFGTSYFLFRNSPAFIGIATILFSVVLVIPAVNRLFLIEERFEVHEKLNFFHKHEHIIDFFVYYFIGVFVTFFVIALVQGNYVFSEGQLHGLENQPQSFVPEDISMENELPPPPTNNTISSIFKNNAYVLIVSFCLSLFYGAGAIFLITLNASIFASALANAIRTKLPGTGFIQMYSFMICNVGIMFLHLIPEVMGYLMAAIAGGVLSQAFAREKIGSSDFKYVVIDSLIMLVFSFIVIFFAAVIESKASAKLIENNTCQVHPYWIIASVGLLVIGMVIFEIYRVKHYRRSKIFKNDDVDNNQ